MLVLHVLLKVALVALILLAIFRIWQRWERNHIIAKLTRNKGSWDWRTMWFIWELDKVRVFEIDPESENGVRITHFGLDRPSIGFNRSDETGYSLILDVGCRGKQVTRKLSNSKNVSLVRMEMQPIIGVLGRKTIWALTGPAAENWPSVEIWDRPENGSYACLLESKGGQKLYLSSKNFPCDMSYPSREVPYYSSWNELPIFIKHLLVGINRTGDMPSFIGWYQEEFQSGPEMLHNGGQWWLKESHPETKATLELVVPYDDPQARERKRGLR